MVCFSQLIATLINGSATAAFSVLTRTTAVMEMRTAMTAVTKMDAVSEVLWDQ